MATQQPVLIVSAFGRGHALATELAQADIPTALLDVSSTLGDVSAEDDEGPFGFTSYGLSHTELQSLWEDHPPLLQVSGFTWVLPRGPLELKGPLTLEHRQHLRIPESVWAWLCGPGPGSTKDLQYLLNANFDETWLYHMSQSFHSNQWAPNYRAGIDGAHIPYASDFFIRSPSRAGLAKSVDALKRAGVLVDWGASILDVAREGGSELRNLEVKLEGSDTAELFSVEQLVWFLSGEETEKMSSRLQEKIFPHGILRPKGSWVRGRFRMNESPQRESLPIHSVWVPDPLLHWTHENLFVVMRTSNAELFDIWFRIPEVFRFQRDYLQRISDRIVQTLTSRMGWDQVEGPSPIVQVDWPVSILKNPQDVGPSRHPLFDEKELASLPAPPWKNFHWVGAEVTHGLAWNDLMGQSRKVARDVKDWWRRREIERIKRLEKERNQGD